MTELIEGQSWLAAVASFLVMAGLAFVPAVPIPVIAGIVGANYPLVLALLINVGGTVAGCIGMFYVCRYFLQRWATKQLVRYQSLAHFIRLLERNPFLAVLTARLLPIMPSAAVNAIAGVTTMPVMVFIAATVLGKLPAMLTFTYAGSQLESEWLQSVVLVCLYVVVIGLATNAWRKRSIK